MFSFIVSLLAAGLPAEAPAYSPSPESWNPRTAERLPAPTDSADWQPRADLPSPHALHSALAVSPGRLLLLGGRRFNADTMSRACLGYSEAEDRWTGLAPMEEERGLAAAAAAGGLVYVLGGCREFGTGLADVEVYDPVADTWAEGLPLPEPLHDHAAVAWRDSLVYALGGGNWSVTAPPSNRVWLFDPTVGAWSAATPLPRALGAPAAALLGDTLFVAGGWTDSGPTNRAWLGVIDTLAPAQIAWREIESLPGEGRCRAAATGLNGRFHVAGGLLPGGRCTAQSWSYDPGLGAWLPGSDLPSPLADAGALVPLGDWLHVCGGYPGTLPYTDAHFRTYAGRYAADCATDLVVSPRGRLAPGTAPVSAIVRNYGESGDTAQVAARATDTLTGETLLERDTLLVLAPGVPTTVEFGSFAAPAGAIIRTAVSTRVPGDENPANDTASAFSRTTPGSDPDGFGYVYESNLEPDTVTFAWFEPAPGDTLGPWLPDPDNGLVARDLPFLFPWYDDTLDEVYICTDGYLSTSEVAAGRNLGLPWPDVNHLIAPLWDDLNLRAAGAVLETVRADTVAFTWLGVPRYEEPGRLATFQVLLFADGRVRFNYLDLGGDRSNSTVGIQGRDGSWQWCLEFVHDGEPAHRVPRDSVSVLFTLPGTGIAERPANPARPGIALSCPSVWRSGPLPVGVPAAALPARLAVYSAAGRLVRALDVEPGRRASWDLRDARGNPVPAGAFFLRLDAAGFSCSRRVAIIR